MADPICLTVDVEWAAAEILNQLVGDLDERGLKATFFVTHDGVDVGGHERAIHPNYRRHRNTLLERHPEWRELPDREYYRQIMEATLAFAPEAAGSRSHSLIFDSDMMGLLSSFGLYYDSSIFLPMMEGLRPVIRRDRFISLPIYYMDHWHIAGNLSGFDLAGLRLEQPGMKVMCFHPNMIYLNCAEARHYDRTKPFYHDVARLREWRNTGTGVGDLWLRLLDRLADHPDNVLTMREVAERVREEVSPL